MVDWNVKYARRTALTKRSSIRELLKLTQKPDIISFAGGLPAPDCFPVERVREATEKVLAERAVESLQYGATEGVTDLRDFIAARMSTRKLTVKTENVIIVGGGQQALDLVGRALVDEGDSIVVENPTYMGALSAWRIYSPTYLAATSDHNGVLPDSLPALFKQNPKFIYLVPSFQNPQGTTLSEERRAELVRLLDEYGVPAVEDNPYSELCFSGTPLRDIYKVDAEYHDSHELEGNVVYVGTLSKLLAPGFRLGWIAAPVEFIDRVVRAKQSADLHTSTFTQLVAYETMKDGFLDEHIARLRTVYKERRDVMLAAMDRFFPEEVTWTRPDGGLFLMVTMPEQIDSNMLLKRALEYKVAFVSGGDFHVNNMGNNTFRLNFSNARPTLIEEGIRRLGNLLHDAVRENPLVEKYALPPFKP